MAADVELEAIECYKKIAFTLIEASPEHLDTVSIRLEDRAKENSVAVILTVSENPADFFSPTDELMFEVNRLGDLLRKNDEMFAVAHFSVSRNAEGKWGYSVDSEYNP